MLEASACDLAARRPFGAPVVSAQEDSMLRIALVLLFAVVVPSVVAAHPGHGDSGDGFGLAHYLTEPVHVFFAVALIVALVGGSAFFARRRSVRSVRSPRR
jgi:hypothetical protein